MDLRNFILVERNHIKWLHTLIPLLWNSRKGKATVTTRAEIGFGQDLDEGIDFKGTQGNFLGWQKCFVLIVVVLIQLCYNCQTSSTVYLKWVNFIMCKLYLNKTGEKQNSFKEGMRGISIMEIERRKLAQIILRFVSEEWHIWAD